MSRYYYLLGLDRKSLKKYPSLIPLFTIVGCAIVGATGYMIRLAIKHPEVSFNKKGNPEPWNAYMNKQYKFYSPGLTEEVLQRKIPEY